jgi:hypothetical protein
MDFLKNTLIYTQYTKQTLNIQANTQYTEQTLNIQSKHKEEDSYVWLPSETVFYLLAANC